MSLFGVLGRSVILTPSVTDFQNSDMQVLCGKIGIWPLFGVKHMIYLELFPSQIC